jgi:gamma-glutamyltranspeptidase / glutathione hydrolase
MSMDHLAELWRITKPAVSSTRGLVVAQDITAAKVGAEILTGGGNAVDAAVATAFALAVTEPWMSGLGGGGYMVGYLADRRQVFAVDFGMVSPADLDVSQFPLVDGFDRDLFLWPKVEGDRNLMGYLSMCVPGAVDGLGLALKEFGTISFKQALWPAVKLAEQGVEVTWFTSLTVAQTAAELIRFPSAAAVFMPDGLPPTASMNVTPTRLRYGNLAATLRRLAEKGRRDFYEGGIAGSLAADTAEGGGFLSADDLANYRARLIEPLSFDYRGVQINTPSGFCAGPTLASAMSTLERRLSPGGTLNGAAFKTYAEVLKGAYEVRLSQMGHAPPPPSCTTHLNVVDARGNMVALTNTLVSRFGSKVLLPRSGVLMNNGVMWFDPRPGRTNSIAPGVRPLSNMCPTVVTRNGEPWLAVGASGGRQIVSAVLQLISFMVDFGLTLEEAFHHPRLDMSGGQTVTCQRDLPGDCIQAVASVLPVQVREATVYPILFAVPSGVIRDPVTGLNVGQADPRRPLSGVAVSGG